MAEIAFNQAYENLTDAQKRQFDGVMGMGGFNERYQKNPESTLVTSDPDYAAFAPISKAYQESKTIPKGNFLSNMFNFSSADASMPDRTYGLQTNTMGGVTINPDGTLNYNNTQTPKNLGFRSMVDMAADTNNFMDQFQTPQAANRYSGMGQLGPNKSDMIGNTIAEEVIDENRIPGRIQESVPNSQNWFEGMMTGAGEGINSLKNKALSGWDSVSGGLKSLMDNTMLGRIAAMRNATNPRAGNYNPALQGQIDFMKEQGAYGNDWDQSGLNKITGGRLAGKNLQSLFGSNDLMDMYGNDLARLEKTLANLPNQWSKLRRGTAAQQKIYADKVKTFQDRIKQNKWEQEQARKDLETRNRIKLGSNLYQDKNYRSDPELSRIGREKYTGRGQAFEQKKSGTFTTPSGKRGYSGGRRDGGRVGYGNGGLATLFTRRG